jgi:hypothetical protein
MIFCSADVVDSCDSDASQDEGVLPATLEVRAAVAEELGVMEEEKEEEEGELEGSAGGAGAAAVAAAAAAPAAPAAAAVGASRVASGGPITFHVLTPCGSLDAQLSISPSAPLLGSVQSHRPGIAL